MTYKRAGAGITVMVLGACAFFFFSSGEGNSSPAPVAAEALSIKRVLMVTLDTTRQDRIGVYGYRPGGQSPTPVLDAFAAEGRHYQDAFTSTPLTLPAHTTLLTGLLPFQHGVRENNDFALLPPETRTFASMPEVFRAKGFQTAAVLSSRVLAAEFGLAAGFDRYVDVESQGDGGQAHFEERGAAETTDEALRWLDQSSDAPSFLWVHYFDPHHPFLPHEGFPGQISRYSGSHYDGEIAYMDQHLGRLFAAYKDRGFWDETLVICVADHGEGLGEHGEETHGFLLHDATLRVPFIVKVPKGLSLPEARVSARLIDLWPTVFHGQQVDSTVARPGVSLFEEGVEFLPAYAETVYPYRQFSWAALTSFRDRNWKLVDGGGRRELFDIDSDRLESVNLVQREEERGRRLHRALLSFRRELGTTADFTRGDSRRNNVEAVRSGAYTGGPSADVAAEPSVDENAALPHPAERMDVLAALNNLTKATTVLSYQRRDEDSQKNFVETQTIVDLLERRAPQSPAIRFWLGRARLKLAQSPLSLELGAKFQRSLCEQALHDMVSYLRMRPLDHRAWNMKHSLRLVLFQQSRDPQHLKALLTDAQEQQSRGLADGLGCALRGQALEKSGQYQQALAAYEEAVKCAPKRRAFLADVERLKIRLGMK